MTDDIKADALGTLESTFNQLHADLAHKLDAAGVPASVDEHTDTLIAKALDAGAALPAGWVQTVAPNSADHALATFKTQMAAAMIKFAEAHLPAKYFPAVELAGTALDEALDGDTSNDSQIAGHAIEAVEAAGAAAFAKGI